MTVNAYLRTVVVELIEAPIDFTDDALSMRTVPTYAPETEISAGPVKAAEELQSCVLPHSPLPEPVQYVTNSFSIRT